MKKFNYVIKDSIGIHARPAGLLVKAAQQFDSKIMINAKGKASDAKRILGLLGLGIKCGEEVTVTVEGADEVQAHDTLKQFFEEQL